MKVLRSSSRHREAAHTVFSQDVEGCVSFLWLCRRSCLVASRPKRVCWACSLRVMLSGPGKFVEKWESGRGVTRTKRKVPVIECVADV